jgi:hypothetical protein
LLSKDNWRGALGDEVVKSGPDVSFVDMAFPLSRARKRLTRAGAGPHGAFPSGEVKGVGPAADTGEEVALVIAFEVTRRYLPHISLVNIALGQVTSGHEVAEPFGGVGLKLAVVDIHASIRSHIRALLLVQTLQTLTNGLGLLNFFPMHSGPRQGRMAQSSRTSGLLKEPTRYFIPLRFLLELRRGRS